MRLYLEALESHKPKRGRKRTPESIQKQLAQIDEQLPDADPMTRLKLSQERMDLSVEWESLTAGNDLVELEAEFIEVARSYSDRTGVSYAAWREIGVAASVLRDAGITRS